MDDQAVPTRQSSRPAEADGANSDQQQLHASRSLQSSLPSDPYPRDDERTRGSAGSTSSSSRQLVQNSLGGSLGNGNGNSNGNNNSLNSSARRRVQRRGRSPPQPRAERSASQLLCPSHSCSSGGGGDGDSPGRNSDSDCHPSRQVEVPASRGDASSAPRQLVAPPPARRGRGRQRQRQRERPRSPPPPDRAEAVASPTPSAAADPTAGLYFYTTSGRTRSNSADTRHSAEQLVSIAQALQRREEKKGAGTPVGGSSTFGSGSDPPRIDSNLPAALSPARSRASRASRAMSATTRSQITDGGWSTGTGSSHSGNNSDHCSDDGSESFVSWNESEHGSLPSHHRRAIDTMIGGRGGGGGGEGKGKGGRRSSATNRMLTQLGVGVGAVPFGGLPTGADDRQSKPPPDTKSTSLPKAPTLSSSARAQRLMDEAQRNVQMRRSKQMGLFGGYEREVPAASASSAAGQHRGEGTSRGSSSGPSAVARALMDSLQDDGHGDDDDSSTADGCYEDVESALADGYDDDDDADDRSAEASVHRLWGRVGIARPAYPFSFGEDDSRDRSEVLDSEVSQRVAEDELEGPQKHQHGHDANSGNTGNLSDKHPNSPSSKSSWISGSVSFGNDDDDASAKVDEHLKEKLGLGQSTLATSNSNNTGGVAKKNDNEKKEYDPFDLGSATTTDSGPVKPPRWLQDQKQGGSKQERHDDESVSSSSSSSGSSSSESYTSGSSSESSLPAEYVVAEPGWDKGSVADSSIKSITAQLRSTVQEEAIREASAGNAINKKPEKLPVYKRMFGRGKGQETDKFRQAQTIPSIREDPEEVESPTERKSDPPKQEQYGSKAIHDPFDLRSSVDEGSKALSKPGLLGEGHRASSPSSSSSSSGSESSYTDGSSSVDRPPARMVVTKEDWAVGSVAESSIKSITAPLRAKASSTPEKLPVYGKPSAGINDEQKTGPLAIAKSASEPSLEPLYVGWGADEVDNNEESSHEGEDNYQAWPDSPQKLRKCPPKPQLTDVDSIQKGWVIVCIENIISPEKADEQEMRAKTLSTRDCEISSSEGVSSSAGSGSDSGKSLESSSGTESSESDVVRKDLAKRELANPNIVHEEQRAVGNLSAMWEAKANEHPDDPTKDEAVVKSRKQAQERIGAFRLRRNGAIALQSAWRSYCARKKWLQIVRSAIAIQKAVRARLLKAVQDIAAKAALLIQSYWRSFWKHQAFARKKKSARLLQSTYRGHVARRNYQCVLRACVKLQALGRGHLQRSRTKCLKQHRAAAVIQVWCYSQLAQKTEVAAACQIQAVWRSHVVQQRYRRQQSAIVKAQAMIRGGLQKKQYARYRLLLKGVIALQSIARGARERSLLAKRNIAVFCIQHHYRSYKISEAMKMERTTAATTIQRAARQSITRKRYKQTRASAILVQTHTRGMLARAEFHRSISAIYMAQAWARGIVCRRQLQEAKERRDLQTESAVTIQSSWRRYFEREVYRQKRSASITLQSAARGHSCRQTYRRHMALVNGVTSLQAVARGAQERRALQRQVAAARYVQSWWRRCVIAAEEENECSATTIASWWRMHSAQKTFAETRDAVMYLQSTARGSSQRRQYQRMLRSCVLIQAFVRRLIAQREHDEQLAAAILIQRTVRRVTAKRIAEEKETAAATILQSSFRSMSLVRSYARQRGASVSIQAAYRGSMQRTRFENHRSMVDSLTAFQAIFRGMQQRKSILKQRESATKIASKWRSRQARTKYLQVVEAAVVLQSIGRGSIVRQSQRQHGEANKRATTIASKWRSRQARAEYLRTVRAVILLQAVGRGTGTRQRQRRDDAAAKCIQSTWRSYRAKRLCAVELRQKNAATKLQTIFRTALARSNFRRAKWSALCIQRQTRGWIQRERFDRYVCLVRGCTSLQSLARGVAARRALTLQNDSARCIQNSWRAYKEDRRQKSDSAAVILQSSCRRLVAQRSYRRQQRSALLIQSTYRMVREKSRFRNYTALVRGIVILQNIARRKLAYRNFEEKRRAVVVLQAWFRSCRERDRFHRYITLVRCCVAFQAQFRGSQVRKAFVAQATAARTIQRAWRLRQERVKSLNVGQTENDSLPKNNDGARAGAEELTRFNSLAISAGSSSNISQYLCNKSDVGGMVMDQQSIDDTRCSGSDGSAQHDSVSTKASSFDASYDEDQVRQALALGAVACVGVSCLPSLGSDASGDDYRQPDLVESDVPSSGSSTGGDNVDLEAGQVGRDFDASSVGSSHLSDYFDDDLPPASRKISSIQTAGVSSEASPKRQALTIDKKSSTSSSCSNSSSSSDQVGFAPTMLPPVVEETFEYGSEEEDVDLVANVDLSPAGPSLATQNVDERKIDCVVPSSYEQLGPSSIRARAEDLARQNTLISASSIMGSSSNLSSCFRDDDYDGLDSKKGYVNEQASIGDNFGSSTSTSRERFEQWNDRGKFNQQRQLLTRPPQQGPGGIDSVDATSKYDSMQKEVSALAMEASLSHTAASMRREASETTRVPPSRAHPSMQSDTSHRSRESGVTMETSLARSMLAQDTNAFNRSFEVSTAGQSTLQHEDKTIGTEVWQATDELGMHPQDMPADDGIEQGLHDDTAAFVEQGAYSLESSDESDTTEKIDVQEDHVDDPHLADLARMEEGNRGERISLIDNADIDQENSSIPAMPSQYLSTASKPPRKSIRSVHRPPSSAVLPMHADNVNGPPSPSENNKFITFYRGHRSWCYIFGLVGVLALIAGIVVAFTVDFTGNSSASAAGIGGGRNDSSAPTAAPSVAPTYRQDNQGGNYLRPSLSPTSPPSRQRLRPTWTSPVDDADYQRFAAVLRQVSNEDDILDTTSSQHKAISWIASDKRMDPYGPFTVQRYVLALLYYSTNGDSWSKCGILSPDCSDNRASFLSDENECSWHGVSCNDDGFVVGLELDRVGMDGAMPEEMGNLSYLERLVLPRNRLASTISSSLGSLRNLLELNLFDNNLSGSIPIELNQLPLEILQISTNKFTGSLPPIFNPDLAILDVSANELSGTLPGELFDATSLKEINLSMNQFSGTLSSYFGRLTALRKFLIGLNSFSGEVPDSIGNMKSLESLHATYNDLTGSIPNTICDLFDYRLKRLSTDCAVPDDLLEPAKIACSCCTLCLEGDE